MQLTGIGIDAKTGPLVRDIAEEMNYFKECEFDIVELSVHDMDIVLNGRKHRAAHDEILALTRAYDFKYTVHAPDRMNLAFNYDPQLEMDVFAASMEFCADVGSGVMVYHSGLSAFYWLLLHGPGAGLPPLSVLEEAKEREALALQKLLPRAAELKVTIAMENMNPHASEAAVVTKAGHPVSALGAFFPALLPSEMVAQLKRVNHPNMGLTLDVAHLFIAANLCGFDYLQSIREAAPYVRHIHIDDNFGRPDYFFEDPRERNTHGEGDLHMPPGWGTIPLAEVYACLPDYLGTAVLELKARYAPYYVEARRTLEPYKAR
jgi:sugar phosphate isomerase/epimerase